MHDTFTAFLPPLLPAFIENLLLTRTEAGLLSVFMQAPSLIQPVIGHLADRFNLRYLVILAPAVTATMMSLLGVAPGYVFLALLLTVVGFSSASLHAVGPVMAGYLSGKNLGRGMSFWMVGGELGRASGPILIVTAVTYLTLKGSAWLMLLGWLSSITLYVRLKDVPVHSFNPRNGLPLRAALKRMKPIMAPLSGIVTARAFMLSALGIYLPTYLTERGDSLWLAGAALTVLEAAGVVGALLGGSMSDRLGRRLVLTISLLTAPLLMNLFLVANTQFHFLILIALGISAFSTTPVVMALVQENFPENRALANGLYMGMSFTIRSVAIILIGVVGDLFGLYLAFFGSAILMLLGLPVIYLLPKDRVPGNFINQPPKN